MYLRHLLSLVCLLLIEFAYGQYLPHYMTAREKMLMMEEDLLPTAPAAADVFILPPQKKVRTIAEWEALQALQITWTSYPSILTEIVRAAKQECRVYIVCKNSQSVIDYLSARGVDTVNVSFVNTRFNSVWSRDYGPWSTYTNDVDSLYTMDWKYNRPRPQDDTIPYTLGRLLQTPTFTTTTAPWKLVNTGGNFMTDGFGTGFASKLILDENKTLSEAGVDSIMQNYMGIQRYIKMTTLPYDDIHHIDMHMKLLDEETLLVGQYPSGVADGPQIEDNLQYILTNFKSVFGTPYKVIRIPMPDDKGKYPNNRGRYFTYTNSSFINKTVIVPTYNIPADTTALRIYREVLPGYKIVGINSLQSIGALGALHCITKEIGEQSPLLISHQSLRNTTNNSKPYSVRAYINHASGIRQAHIYWRTDTLQPYKIVVMNRVQGQQNIWAGNIPAQAAGKTIYYYIQGKSNDGKIQNRPMPAPEGYWKFSISNNSIVSNISTLPPFPNPAQQMVSISASAKRQTKISIIISTTDHHKIKDVYNGLIAGDNIFQVDISELKSGLYLIEYVSEGAVYTEKLIVD